MSVWVFYNQHPENIIGGNKLNRVLLSMIAIIFDKPLLHTLQNKIKKQPKQLIDSIEWKIL